MKIIIKNLIDYFNSKSKVIWKSKKQGFYLDISKSINIYKFKPSKTSKTLAYYIRKKYSI